MERMNIPEEDHVCCAADLFEYDENKKLNLRQFFSHYKDQFPMLIVIIGGHYGETKFDCYDNYQVLRIHCYTSQPRVVADDARLNPTVQKGYITIPEDTLIKFRLVKGHTQLGGPQPLWELLEENDRLPLIVQMACDSRYPVRIGSTKYEARDLGNIMIKEKYEEHFFIMNAIDTVELDMNKLTCMACLSEDLDAAPVTGFKYASKAEFDKFCRKLAKDVAESGVVYDTSRGNDDFGEYSFDEMRSLLEISNNATGLLTEEEEADDLAGVVDYEEIPPLLPSRNPVHKQNTPEDKATTELARKNKHKLSLTSKPTNASSPKSPDSPKLHHRDAKAVIGFLKKKLGRSGEKDDASTEVPEVPVKHFDSNDGHHSNFEQLPLPPKGLLHVKKDENKRDFYSYVDAKPGYVKISAHKAYQNTQIGRATVKPMQQVNNDAEDTSYLEMNTEDKGDQLYETLDEKISVKQSHTIPPKGHGKRTQSRDKEFAENVKKYSDAIEESKEESEDMEEYGTCTFARGVQQGIKGNMVSPQAQKPLDHEVKQFSDREQISPPDDQEKADFNESVKSMSINDVCEHLKFFKLEQYAEVFEENQIDGYILTSLSVEDLQKELGLRKIEAIKLNKFATTGHIPR